MAGKLIPLVSKRAYDFSLLPQNGSLRITAAEHIDISQYCDGILITRVHSISLTGASILLSLMPDGYTPTDPQSFPGSSGGAYFNHATSLDSSTAAGSVTSVGGADGEFGGEYALLSILCLRNATAPSPGIASLVISVDLLVRTPDDVDQIVPAAVMRSCGCPSDDQLG